jgi:hypothetical protein
MLHQEEIRILIDLVDEKIKDLNFCIAAGGEDDCGTISSRLRVIYKIKEKLMKDDYVENN